MRIRDFLKAGHMPSLVCAFLYFDISFMVWVLFGALAVLIAADYQLTETQRGLMLALPLLAGAILRLVLGAMTDHIGARKTGIIGLTLTLLPLTLGWVWVDSYERVLVVAAMLGVAGASFAVALPLASRWYPPHFQGLAMGIAGAGNSGTALANLFAPMIAIAVGWQAVFGIALVPIAATLIIFVLFAKDSPNQPPAKSLRDYVNILGHSDTWWFCVFYSVTFGGFVGLAVFLTTFFNVQYGQDSVVAGRFAGLCVIAGSFLRPVGGYLADRFGGIRMLVALFLGVTLTMSALATLPANAYVGAALMFLCMGFLGMGNGSVFQLVPLRFPKEIGVITGIVGAAGGVGGFLLPSLFGLLKDQTGSFGGGLLAFGLTALICAGVLLLVSRRWEGAFVGRGGKAMSGDPEPAIEVPATPLPEPIEA